MFFIIIAEVARHDGTQTLLLSLFEIMCMLAIQIYFPAHTYEKHICVQYLL